MVLPVLKVSGLDSFSLKHFFALRVFHGRLHLPLLVLGLSPQGVRHLLFGQLLQGLGGHVVARLEHLILVLLSEIDSLVNCVLVDVGLLSWVLILLNYALGVVIIHVRGSHHVWNFVQALFLNQPKNNCQYMPK